VRQTAVTRLDAMLLAAVDEQCGMRWVQSGIIPFPLVLEKEGEGIGSVDKRLEWPGAYEG